MQRDFFSRFTRGSWLHRSAMALGLLTFVVETLCFLWVYLYHHLQHLLEAVLPLVGGIIGLSTLLVWWRNGFLAKEDERQVARDDAPAAATVPNATNATNGLPLSAASSQPIAPTLPLVRRIVRPQTYKDQLENALTQPMPPITRMELAYCAFTVPKEHREQQFSQDKFDAYSDQERCRFAVADGVGASFLPSKWAELVTRQFVELTEDFSTPQKCAEWLAPCCEAWSFWADHEWIPKMRQQRKTFYDWTKDRQRGAETTFIGCSFSPLALVQTGRTNIRVTAVGDAVFFLAHPPASPAGAWQHESFALDNAQDFGLTPRTLLSVEKDLQKAWYVVQQHIYQAHYNDSLFLTTDALAKWILLSIEQGQSPWERLLALKTQSDFAAFVSEERRNASIELDDTTMLVVTLA